MCNKLSHIQYSGSQKIESISFFLHLRDFGNLGGFIPQRGAWQIKVSQLLDTQAENESCYQWKRWNKIYIFFHFQELEVVTACPESY